MNAQLTRLVIDRPSEARRVMLRAYADSLANYTAAAKLLDIGLRTFFRYEETLGIKKRMQAVRARGVREGWAWKKPSGRPSGSKDTYARSVDESTYPRAKREA